MAKVKAGKKSKAAKDSGKGNGIQPIPKSGPNLTLRARNHVQIGRFKKAAEKTGLSMNTWAIEVLEQASQVA